MMSLLRCFFLMTAISLISSCTYKLDLLSSQLDVLDLPSISVPGLTLPQIGLQIGKTGFVSPVPGSLAVDSDGNYYIASNLSSLVYKMNASGEHITTFGYEFEGKLLNNITLDSQDHVIVTSQIAGKFAIYSKDGALINLVTRASAFAVATNSLNQILIGAGSTIYVYNSSGTAVTSHAAPAVISGMKVNASDEIFLTSSVTSRAYKLDSAYALQLTLGTSAGSADGQFAHPHGITVDSLGNIYVMDTDNSRVQKFDSAGAFITKWAIGNFFINPSIAGGGTSRSIYCNAQDEIFVPNTYGTERYNSSGTLIDTLANHGSQNQEFIAPMAVHIKGNDDLIVLDTGNSRLQFFSNNGTFIKKIDLVDSLISMIDGISMAVDNSENFYIFDNTRRIIGKYSSAGVLLSEWGGPGVTDGLFGAAGFQLAIDTTNNILYAMDSSNNRVQKFDFNGNFLSSISIASPKAITIEPMTKQLVTIATSGGSLRAYFHDELGVQQNMLSLANTNTYAATGVTIHDNKIYLSAFTIPIPPLIKAYSISDGSFIKNVALAGTERGQLGSISYSMAFDSQGTLFVADAFSHRIQTLKENNLYYLSSEGYTLFIDSLDNFWVHDAYTQKKYDSNGDFLFSFGSQGAGNGQFDSSVRLTTEDHLGNIYVSDFAQNRIQKFTSAGTFIQLWASDSIPVAYFNNHIYTASSSSGLIEKFDLSGTLIAQFGLGNGSADGQLNFPLDIKVDTNGDIYVADLNCRIQVFNTAGVFQRSLPTCSTPGQLTFFTLVGSEVLASSSSANKVQKINATTGAVNSYWISSAPTGIAKNSAGKVFTSSPYRPMMRYNTTTNREE